MSLQELIQACAGPGDAASWEQFIAHFHSLIAGVATRVARRCGGAVTPALVDDLVQETLMKLCADRKRLLAAYNPAKPDTFYGFIKVVTANVVYDHYRGERAVKRGTSDATSSLDEPGAATPVAISGSAQRIERQILLDQIDRLLQAEATGSECARDRTIFWLHYRHGFTAAAIAAAPFISLSVKGVESVIQRLTRLVRTRLAA